MLCLVLCELWVLSDLCTLCTSDLGAFVGDFLLLYEGMFSGVLFLPDLVSAVVFKVSVWLIGSIPGEGCVVVFGKVFWISAAVGMSRISNMLVVGFGDNASGRGSLLGMVLVSSSLSSALSNSLESVSVSISVSVV